MNIATIIRYKFLKWLLQGPALHELLEVTLYDSKEFIVPDRCLHLLESTHSLKLTHT